MSLGLSHRFLQLSLRASHISKSPRGPPATHTQVSRAGQYYHWHVTETLLHKLHLKFSACICKFYDTSTQDISLSNGMHMTAAGRKGAIAPKLPSKFRIGRLRRVLHAWLVSQADLSGLTCICYPQEPDPSKGWRGPEAHASTCGHEREECSDLPRRTLEPLGRPFAYSTPPHSPPRLKSTHRQLPP